MNNHILSRESDGKPLGPLRLFRTQRILVVDNLPASTRLVRLMLERHTGFEVCEVNDSTQALTSAARFKPDLILLDIEMPGLDGGTLAARMQADPTIGPAPIVFMTSLVTEMEAAQPMFTGGARVLAKPLTVGKLLGCVAELLSAAVADRPSLHAGGGGSREVSGART